MDRNVTRQVTGFATIDGAGVHLIRVLGNTTVEDYDPFLMLDSFDSTNGKAPRAGICPWITMPSSWKRALP